MAFGGVEIGIMKPRLAPSVVAMAGASGSTPDACDTAMTTGTIMFADAVFEVVSDSTIATAVKSTVSAEACVGAGDQEVIASPNALARPVVNASSPMRQPAAVEQDDAPLDVRRPDPRSA